MIKTQALHDRHPKVLLIMPRTPIDRWVRGSVFVTSPAAALPRAAALANKARLSCFADLPTKAAVVRNTFLVSTCCVGRTAVHSVDQSPPPQLLLCKVDYSSDRLSANIPFLWCFLTLSHAARQGVHRRPPASWGGLWWHVPPASSLR